MTLVKVNNRPARTVSSWMNEFFNDFPGVFGESKWADDVSSIVPAVNVAENAENFQLEILAPGFEKGDFKVNVDDHLLTISAEKTIKENKEDKNYIRREFSHKTFKRSFSLDERIDATNIDGRYENGVLYLSLPKREEVKAAAKEIQIH